MTKATSQDIPRFDERRARKQNSRIVPRSVRVCSCPPPTARAHACVEAPLSRGACCRHALILLHSRRALFLSRSLRRCFLKLTESLKDVVWPSDFDGTPFTEADLLAELNTPVDGQAILEKVAASLEATGVLDYCSPSQLRLITDEGDRIGLLASPDVVYGGETIVTVYSELIGGGRKHGSGRKRRLPDSPSTVAWLADEAAVAAVEAEAAAAAPTAVLPTPEQLAQEPEVRKHLYVAIKKGFGKWGPGSEALRQTMVAAGIDLSTEGAWKSFEPIMKAYIGSLPDPKTDKVAAKAQGIDKTFIAKAATALNEELPYQTKSFWVRGGEASIAAPPLSLATLTPCACSVGRQSSPKSRRRRAAVVVAARMRGTRCAPSGASTCAYSSAAASALLLATRPTPARRTRPRAAQARAAGLRTRAHAACGSTASALRSSSRTPRPCTAATVSSHPRH